MSVGAYQGDAGREIDGQLQAIIYNGFIGNKAFSLDVANLLGTMPNGTTHGQGNYDFKASRVVPTSHEFRPAAISALSCITY